MGKGLLATKERTSDELNGEKAVKIRPNTTDVRQHGAKQQTRSPQEKVEKELDQLKQSSLN